MYCGNRKSASDFQNGCSTHITDFLHHHTRAGLVEATTVMEICWDSHISVSVYNPLKSVSAFRTLPESEKQPHVEIGLEQSKYVQVHVPE